MSPFLARLGGSGTGRDGGDDERAGRFDDRDQRTDRVIAIGLEKVERQQENDQRAVIDRNVEPA